jgi:hypothetical protein
MNDITLEEREGEDIIITITKSIKELLYILKLMERIDCLIKQMKMQ